MKIGELFKNREVTFKSDPYADRVAERDKYRRALMKLGVNVNLIGTKYEDLELSRHIPDHPKKVMKWEKQGNSLEPVLVQPTTGVLTFELVGSEVRAIVTQVPDN